VIIHYLDVIGMDHFRINTIRVQKGLCEDEKKCLETVVDLLSLNQIGVSGKLALSGFDELHYLTVREHLCCLELPGDCKFYRTRCL
jgi:hypothetical protein